jgi:excisionase family DNA binding protein
MNTELPKVFTVAEVADQLGCGDSTVYRMIDAGTLRAIRIGSGTKRPGLRITEDALRAYLEGRAA